ncbi:MAG: flagellar biosynthetic protein FliO [Deltaproteobacteria bacterium]|nr:flagellar biosynthetic protein FliO [Deltaproteobacteria bacterium]
MDPALPAGTTGFGWALLHTLGALALVCALAWWVLRLAAQREHGGAPGRMKLLERVALDPRRSVVLLQVGARVLVVGVGDGRLTTLAELREDELPALPEAPARPGVTFAEVLATLRRAPPPPRSPEAPPARDPTL